MKDIFNFGDNWRVTFKRTMWVSFVIFELVSIFFSISFGNSAIGYGWATSDSAWLLSVICLVITTVVNESIHSLWACAAYMFEDIAQTRKVNERIMELLEKQEKQEKDYSVKRYYDEDDDLPIRTLSLNDNSTSSANPAPPVSAEEERMRLIRERMPAKQSREYPKVWVCPECGTGNPTTSSFCKDCGHYK